jgi:glucose/arabinose dehydrogenase
MHANQRFSIVASIVQINGCKVTGRLVRWPYANGQVTGPEQIVIEGGNGNMICGQFASHSITVVIVGPDNALYVGVGDGASFTAPDAGMFGPLVPCALQSIPVLLWWILSHLR